MSKEQIELKKGEAEKQIAHYLDLSRKALAGQIEGERLSPVCRSCLCRLKPVGKGCAVCMNGDCKLAVNYGHPKWPEEDRKLWNEVNRTAGVPAALHSAIHQCWLARMDRLERHPEELKYNSHDICYATCWTPRAKCLTHRIFRESGKANCGSWDFLVLCWEFREERHTVVTPVAVLRAAKSYYGLDMEKLEEYHNLLFSLKEIKEYECTL